MDQQIVTVLGSSPASVNWLLEALKIVPSVIVAAAVGLAGYLIGKKQVGIADSQLKLSTATYDLSKAQKEIAEAKLKLDLFGRRHKVYLQTVDFIQEVLQAKRFDNVDFERFKLVMVDSDFLFGAEIHSELAEIKKEAEHWRDTFEEFKELGLSDDRQERFSEISQEKEDYFSHQLAVLHTRFAKYLSFEKWQ